MFPWFEPDLPTIHFELSIIEVTEEFKKQFLEETNQYRRLHSASGLTWSMYLSTKAQQWAEYVAGKDK